MPLGSQIDDLAPSSSSLVITPEKLSALYSRYRLNPEIYPFIGELWLICLVISEYSQLAGFTHAIMGALLK